MTQTIITGCGAYLPEHCVSNDELAERLDTSDAWIRSRTGIAQRHIAAENEHTSDLAANAGKAALADAGINADAIDMVIVATSTPDTTMPSTAAWAQAKMGCVNAAAMDISAACSGFVYGLSVAHGLVQSGQAKKILLIGAEMMSRIIDWEDRAICVLFGDGAGAVVIEASEEQGRGIHAVKIHADGREAPILQTDGGVSLSKTAGHLQMAGKEVFRHAVDKMGNAITDIAALADVPMEQVDWVIPHQANLRIVKAIAKHISLPEEKCIVTLDRHANTSAASIPLALATAHSEGKIHKGQKIIFTALGAGLTWGSCIITW